MAALFVVTAVREVVCDGSAGCELMFGVGRLVVSPVLTGSSMVVGAPLRVLSAVVALVVVASSRRVGELPLVLSEIEDCDVPLLSWLVGWSDIVVGGLVHLVQLFDLLAGCTLPYCVPLLSFFDFF
jgi:hypothetical protein